PPLPPTAGPEPETARPTDKEPDAPDGPEPEQPIPDTWTYTVREGDRCWKMAKQCTGDFFKFTELGPPINPDLDVSRPEKCDVVIGKTMSIPGNWPRDCLD